MFTQKQINRLYRSRMKLTRAQFFALGNSISLSELERNKELRRYFAKILHQLELIEELNRSFE